jgi:hypothetical protein
MDDLTLLLDVLLAMLLRSDKGYWRPDTSMSPRQNQS